MPSKYVSEMMLIILPRTDNALAVASKNLNTDHRPDFTNTEPAANIGPFPQWSDPKKIVAMDPLGTSFRFPRDCFFRLSTAPCNLTRWLFVSVLDSVTAHRILTTRRTNHMICWQVIFLLGCSRISSRKKTSIFDPPLQSLKRI